MVANLITEFLMHLFEVHLLGIQTHISRMPFFNFLFLGYCKNANVAFVNSMVNIYYVRL